MLLRWMIPVLTASALLAGCNRDTSPPPKFAAAMDGPGGRALLPIEVPAAKDETLLGPIAAADEVEQPQAAAETDVEIDNSTPDALAGALVQMAEANDWSRLPDLLVAEQAEVARNMGEALTAFAAAVGDVHQASAEQFETSAIAIALDELWLQSLADMADRLRVEEVIEDAGETRIVLTAGPEGAAEPKRIELTARQVDDGWRLVLPEFEPPADPQVFAEQLQTKAANFADLAMRIEAKEVADAGAAADEAEKIVAGDYVASAAGEEAGETAETAQPASAEPGAPAKFPLGQPKREREAVDEAYSGPGMLRGR